MTTALHALIAVADSVQRDKIASTLQKSAFVVTAVEDGQQLLDSLDAIRPTLFILDVDLPRISGLKVCKTLRQTNSYRDTPIIVLTEATETHSIDEAYRLGATDFVSKPIRWPFFIHRVRYTQQTSTARQELRKSEAQNKAFIQAIPDLLLVVDRSTGGVQRVGGSGDLASEWLFGQRYPANVSQLPDEIAVSWKKQIASVLKNGVTRRGEFVRPEQTDSRHYETRMVPFAADRVLIVIRDISEQKQATAKVYRLAFFDTLTGLPNRQAFLTQLAAGIEDAEQNKTMLSILYLDLDNFKRINESLGHSFGDELLKTVSERIDQCIRADDYLARYGRTASHLNLARLGGDEFTILLKDVKNADEAAMVAQRICEAVSLPISQDGHEFVITPSIGIANYPDDGEDIDTLVKNADTAMYHAKRIGKNSYQLFSGTMSVRSLEHLDLEHSLRRAIGGDELALHFQPKLNLGSGHITGVEALLRWTHPERGSISPEKFIPLAEETGLIADLSDWVLHSACRQLKTWESGPLAKMPIAINLSGKLFAHSDMYRVLKSAIAEYAIDPSLIDLELTENELMRDADGAIVTLQKLKDAGFSLYVDDFGTGYSSLSYLKKFPIDALKIDRSFVMDLEKSEDNQSICAAIIALAHSLHLKVIAEGVELEEQSRLLRLLQCDEIQGYHFCRPADAATIESFISDERHNVGVVPLRIRHQV